LENPEIIISRIDTDYFHGNKVLTPFLGQADSIFYSVHRGNWSDEMLYRKLEKVAASKIWGDNELFITAISAIREYHDREFRENMASRLDSMTDHQEKKVVLYNYDDLEGKLH